MAVAVTDSQWEEVLWAGDTEEQARKDAAENKEEEGNSIFFSGDHEEVVQKGDWLGVDRDKKASFMIIGALRSEGLL